MSNFPLKPLWNNVIIKRMESKKSSLIVPETASDKMGDKNMFEVVACGPGRNNTPPPVQEGDIVLLASQAGCIGLDYGSSIDPISKVPSVNYFLLPDTALGAIIKEATNEA